MDGKMTGKSTQNINEIRRMRNRVLINMVVRGYEVWQHREFREGRTEHGNKTIIIYIVKRDKEVKEGLYIRYMSTKRK
jgi:hypothetical protein